MVAPLPGGVTSGMRRRLVQNAQLIVDWSEPDCVDTCENAPTIMLENLRIRRFRERPSRLFICYSR